MSNKQRKKFYLPPSDELIETYARSVCQEFAKLQSSEPDEGSEMTWEFIGFLKVAGRIIAAHLNKHSEDEKLDSDAEPS